MQSLSGLGLPGLLISQMYLLKAGLMVITDWKGRSCRSFLLYTMHLDDSLHKVVQIFLMLGNILTYSHKDRGVILHDLTGCLQVSEVSLQFFKHYKNAKRNVEFFWKLGAIIDHYVIEIATVAPKF